MIAVVVVEYATSRPPRAHDASRVVVAAESETEARLIACQVVESRAGARRVRATELERHGAYMSRNVDVVMAVSATVVDLLEV